MFKLTTYKLTATERLAAEAAVDANDDAALMTVLRNSREREVAKHVCNEACKIAAEFECPCSSAPEPCEDCEKFFFLHPDAI